MRTCPKCAYTRKLADKDKPDWQCPSCGIAYAKYDSPAASMAAPHAVRAMQEEHAPAELPVSRAALFWILACVVAAGYLGYSRLVAKPAAVEQKIANAERAGRAQRLSAEVSAELARITPSSVVMFATSWCGYCAQARKLFREQGVRFTEIDVEADAEASRFQSEQLRANGVPTIVIGNRLIRGYDEGQILAGLKEL
ncbi:MAG: glutaredoxin family protein [Betaproteobacteria bacterium]